MDKTIVKEIMQQMTIEEKVAICRANSKFCSNGVERLGIDELRLSDGPHGVREEHERYSWASLMREEDKCTYLPTASVLSATWNKSLASDFGDCLGGEARARDKDIILGPGLNIMRTPLCGRNFEYFSEDPYLVKEMSVPVIKGIQRNDVAACAKHYALNNQEKNRHGINVRVGNRALYETYLYAFEAAVKEGEVYSVMGSYNLYEGEHCCHNKHLIQDILKGEFGFDGVYITDWGGCHNFEEAVFNGLDLEMGTCDDYDAFYFSKDFEELVKKDEKAARELDDKVERILTLMLRVKKIGDANRSTGEFNTKRHQQIAYNVASEGIVLLKNDDNLLPLKNKKTILAVGPNVDREHAMGGNSSHVYALYETTPLEGLKNNCPVGSEIIHIPYITEDEIQIREEYMDTVDNKSGCKGFRRDAFLSDDFSGECFETEFMVSPSFNEEDKKDLAYRFSGTVTIPQDDRYRFTLHGKKGVSFSINGHSKLVFDEDSITKKSHFSRCKKGDRLELVIEVEPNAADAALKLGWMMTSKEESNLQNEVLEVAKTADSVIYFGGLDHEYDTEGFDRNDMKLPSGQDEFIEKLLDIRDDLVVCMIAGSAVEMPWIDRAKAVLWCGYAGMEGGNALADIVFGNISPSGHLSYTLPVHYEDTPVSRYGEYNPDDEYYYDDIYVGYKGFEKDDVKPMFPFGHDLTYSQFELKDFTWKSKNTISLSITNCGKMKAKEVVQLYIGRTGAGLEFPLKELRDFKKVELDCNETTTIEFEIKPEALKYYSEAENQYKYPENETEYRVYIGTSSQAIVYQSSNKL